MTTPTPTERVFLPVPDAMSIALEYDVSGQPAVVVIGAGNAPGSGPPFDIGQALAYEFHSLCRPLMATSCTLKSITARALDGTGDSVTYALPASLAGTAAGGLITAYATLVRWQTTGNGRSGRGRNYIPGFTISGMNADGRTLSSTYTTAANALVTAMTDDTGGSAPFAVISRTKGTYSPVISGSVSPVVGIQRRRLRD
jgi:hypothetical protein